MLLENKSSSGGAIMAGVLDSLPLGEAQRDDKLRDTSLRPSPSPRRIFNTPRSCGAASKCISCGFTEGKSQLGRLRCRFRRLVSLVSRSADNFFDRLSISLRGSGDE